MQVTSGILGVYFAETLNLLTVSAPLSRLLVLHLWHAEEPWPQTFPGAAGSPVFRQSRRPDSKTPRQPALRRRGRCHRPDNIVSAAVRGTNQLWHDELTTRLIVVCRLAAASP